ncbi:hypothetical protein BDR07DRAFT_1462011 [Suillus spraguei]|nr:hypothetical protein BDR07DRAFT_1462011 [Suillus spraguei]
MTFSPIKHNHDLVLSFSTYSVNWDNGVKSEYNRHHFHDTKLQVSPVVISQMSGLYLKQIRDAVKLGLPMGVKNFKFTFECRTPGPIDIEIFIRKSLRSLSSSADTVGVPDTSNVHTETLGILPSRSTSLDEMSFLLNENFAVVFRGSTPIAWC